MQLFFCLLMALCTCVLGSARLRSWQKEFLQIYNTPPEWMLEQIREDLSHITPQEAAPSALDSFIHSYEQQNESWILTRIAIRNNSVIFSNWCAPADAPHENLRRDRLGALKLALQRLAQCTPLPDVDFIVSIHDSFNIPAPIPIFGFAKNKYWGPKTVLMPDFEALRGHESLLDSVRKGNERFPWGRKKNEACFRGAMTGGIFTPDNFLEFPRSKAVTLSLEFPQMVDARFTCVPDCSKFKPQFAHYFSAPLSTEEQIAFKYQLLIDGWSCAYSRAYWQLFSSCVILKQQTDNIQWYYRMLKPFVHFVPVREDMSDLREVIEWAMAHDAECSAISSNAQAFAKDNLTHARVMQYLYHLLVQYGALQKK